MNLFDTLPGSFFNRLASGEARTGSTRTACFSIYHEYDREITYRNPEKPGTGRSCRSNPMEHQVEKLEDETGGKYELQRDGQRGNPPFLLPGSGVAGGGHRRCHL